MNNKYDYKMFATRWTEGAEFCYNRGCVCEGCYMQYFLESQKCEMKQAVLKLVKLFGKPTKKVRKLNKNELNVIKAILDGCSNRKELKMTTGLTHANLQFILRNLYQIAKKDGFVVFQGKDSLPEFLNYVNQNSFQFINE